MFLLKNIKKLKRILLAINYFRYGMEGYCSDLRIVCTLIHNFVPHSANFEQSAGFYINFKINKH